MLHHVPSEARVEIILEALECRRVLLQQDLSRLTNAGRNQLAPCADTLASSVPRLRAISRGGCLEAKLQGCAALELRRRVVLQRRLPQREGAHRRRLLRKETLELRSKALQGGLHGLGHHRHDSKLSLETLPDSELLEHVKCDCCTINTELDLWATLGGAGESHAIHRLLK